MSTELKSCPFCGGKAEFYSGSIIYEPSIECTKCGARTFEANANDYSVPKKSRKAVMKAWNKRVDS